MDIPASPARRQQLRWKLTLSYTAVTVGALLTVELILLGALSVLSFALVNSGLLPAQLIETVSVSYTPTLRAYLAQSPPDQEGIADWLEIVGSWPAIPLDFSANDELFIVGGDGTLLGARPPDLVGGSLIGQPLEFGAIPGLAAPLQAALAGEEDVDQLYALDGPDGKVVMAVPIWDGDREQVLGVLVGMAERPTVGTLLGDVLPILGVSLLLFTLVAALAGTAFGYLAARGPVQRLNRLAGATQAWSEGDFTAFVDDSSGDELGQLARLLNDMARRLQQLLEARRELAVVEERNRLARDLHDSAKQQAFAAAAQISAAKTLLKEDPEAAATHIEEAERLTDDLRKELTTLIQELRPVALEDKGLAAAIREYATDWSRQNGVEQEVRVKGERSLPLEIEQTLFRVVQEALANVARHSEANGVEILLLYSKEEIAITVTDDGHGFDVTGERSGFGLSSMRQRAEAAGGDFRVDSVLGEGTSVSCTVPVTHSQKGRKAEDHE
jgi:NarL family two-component system sensor histidine kinase LiaS